MGISDKPMWIENHRPSSLSDVVGQDHIVQRLRYMVDQIHDHGNDGSFPHLMFAGRAGVGKTTTAVALMKDLFGEDWSSNFIELNASDERSINVIRTTVKDFAKRGVIGSYRKDDREIQIPFNVIFLDECDSLTQDAQSALRRIMERYSKQTRFILSCNYPHRIIDPIRDRCAFADARFRPIHKKAIFHALKRVVGTEDLSVETDALKEIAIVCDGSMRRALNTLFMITRSPDLATIEDVRDVVAIPSRSKVQDLLALAIDANRSDDQKKFQKIHRQIDSVVERHAENGVSGIEILSLILDLVEQDPKVPNGLRRKIYGHMGEAIFQTSISQDEMLPIKVFLRQVTA